MCLPWLIGKRLGGLERKKSMGGNVMWRCKCNNNSNNNPNNNNNNPCTSSLPLPLLILFHKYFITNHQTL